MKLRKISTLVLAVTPLLLAGCKDTDRPLSYEKGVYGGKADTKLTSEQVEALRQRGIAVLPEEEIPKGTEDLVVDATGAPGGFRAARRAVRSRGTLVLKSTYAGKLEMDASALVVDEITLVGSRCGPFPPALRLMEQQLVNPALLLEAVFPLGEGTAAVEKAGQSGVLKVALQPEQD